MIFQDAQQRQFFLKIERGRTRHPERPIDNDRFLIGAGSNCNLQLGGEMPILHSVLITNSDGLWIDAVVREPQLLVNRQPVQACALNAGDLVEIGSFVFVVIEKPAAESVDLEDYEVDENVDLRELSAEDLIDLLAAEISTLETLDASRQNGARSLLSAISAASQGTSEMPHSEMALENRSLGEQLVLRGAELDQREAILAQKAEHLLRAQERLENYLEKITARVAAESASDDDNPFRKTA